MIHEFQAVRNILQRYSFIFVAQAFILTGKRSLKDEDKVENERKRKEKIISKTKL